MRNCNNICRTFTMHVDHHYSTARIMGFNTNRFNQQYWRNAWRYWRLTLLQTFGQIIQFWIVDLCVSCRSTFELPVLGIIQLSTILVVLRKSGTMQLAKDKDYHTFKKAVAVGFNTPYLLSWRCSLCQKLAKDHAVL